MKKIVMALASLALVFGIVSCASTKADDGIDAPEGFEFEQEDDGLLHLDYKYIGTAKGTTANKLKNVTIISNKDYSKAVPLDIYCDEPEEPEFLGKKCVKVNSNGDGNIRTIWLFDKPIPANSISTFKFSVAGLDVDNNWTWNIALLYNDTPADGAEHASAMYTGNMSTTEWTETVIDLPTNEGLWGNAYKPEGEFIGIQMFYGGRDPIFIKDIEIK